MKAKAREGKEREGKGRGNLLLFNFTFGYATDISLITFHQHATLLHVIDYPSASFPDGVGIPGQAAYRTPFVPPAVSVNFCTLS